MAFKLHKHSLIHNDLPTTYQQYIHRSRYARWNDDLGRRETWEETVDRYFAFFRSFLENKGLKLNKEREREIFTDCRNAVMNLDIMPSMRALMTAGPALERDHMAGFNCSFFAVDNPNAFDEAMYVLMCGTGVGFSVETKFTTKLPEVPKKLYPSPSVIVVEDSKLGWATAYRELIAMLYAAKIPNWDVSNLRPAGARLKTFGGRASGPDPLVKLFQFTVKTFKAAVGRRLNSQECHDLMCCIGETVVVGGVRRSALISLSDLGDDRMRTAKSGHWWEANPQRALANNSAVYEEKPDLGTFMKEWISLYESKSGERGLFNRNAAKKQVAKNKRRETDHDFGTNPCSEIILRPFEVCNLSEIVVRQEDTPETLKAKGRLAAILGTLQSMLTDFRYVRDIWRENAEEERLLGVSMTGILDNAYMSGSKQYTNKAGEVEKLSQILESVKEVCIESNREYAEYFGIPQATAVTCVKPSGTVSQLVDASSGIHPRYSRYFIRTVRADKKDPLAKFMRAKGFPVEDDLMKPGTGDIFAFPMQAPEHAVLRDDFSAMEQLKLGLMYQRYWCEHKVSQTVYVKENEWLEVAAFVYRNFDELSGVSFLPHTDHTYQQAPYQEITEEQYNQALATMPSDIDWKEMALFEQDDQTEGAQTLACVGGVCELAV